MGELTYKGVNKTMFIRSKKRAQSTLEYAVIIAVVVGALIAMQVYVKRGLQGRLRQATDDIGDQFAPGVTTTNYTTVSNVITNEWINTATGTANMTGTRTNSIQNQVRNGTENVAAQTNEWWFTNGS
jgi:Flp pilus assembly pilin Flp